MVWSGLIAVTAAGLQLFAKPEDSTSVVSTAKRSFDSSVSTRGWLTTAARNCPATSLAKSRSQLLVMCRRTRSDRRTHRLPGWRRAQSVDPGVKGFTLGCPSGSPLDHRHDCSLILYRSPRARSMIGTAVRGLLQLYRAGLVQAKSCESV